MITWKRMSAEYLELTMNWRMQPDITKNMYTDPVLNIEMQREWLNKIQKDSSQMHWVTLKDGKPIGMTNLTSIDHVNKRCVSGGYIAAAVDRDFKSVISNECGLLKAAFGILKLDRIQAEVMGNNERVAKMLEFEGYHRDGVLRRFIRKGEECFDIIIMSMLREEWESGKMRYHYDVEIEL